MGIHIDPNEFDPRRATTVKGLGAQYAETFTDASLRAYFHRAEPHLNSRGERVEGNGLAGAIRRVGGRYGKILVDPILFEKWLRGQPCPVAEHRSAA
jgi:hypothetical protein